MLYQIYVVTKLEGEIMDVLNLHPGNWSRAGAETSLPVHDLGLCQEEDVDKLLISPVINTYYDGSFVFEHENGAVLLGAVVQNLTAFSALDYFCKTIKPRKIIYTVEWHSEAEAISTKPVIEADTASEAYKQAFQFLSVYFKPLKLDSDYEDNVSHGNKDTAPHQIWFARDTFIGKVLARVIRKEV